MALAAAAGACRGLRARRHRAHGDAPLAAIDGLHTLCITKPNKRAPIIRVFQKQPLEQELIEKIAPSGRAELAADAKGRHLHFGGRGLLRLPCQVLDDAPAAEAAAKAMN